MNNRIAIYPGTFDPLTLGHIDILERVSMLFDKIILAVSLNSRKIPIFSIEERVSYAHDEIKNLKLFNVEVKSFEGLLVNFVKEQNAQVIVRGIRALSDFEYEFQMAYINSKLFQGIETVFLPATERGHFISSTIAKEVAKLGGDLSGLVTERIAKALRARFPREDIKLSKINSESKRVF